MRHFVRLPAITYLLIGVVSLAACNQPAVTPKMPAFQRSENTVHDWDGIADKIASALGANGLLPGVAPPGSLAVAPARPTFIKLQGPDAAFLQAVGGRLEADILEAGGSIARTPAGATVVNLDVNFVSWGPRDKPPGLLGTTAGIL